MQEKYNRLAIQLAFLVACLYTGVGIFRLGFVTNFLSHAVIGGFTSGAAITIGLSQVKYILGISIPRQDRLQDQAKTYVDNMHNMKWQVQAGARARGEGMQGGVAALPVFSSKHGTQACEYMPLPLPTPCSRPSRCSPQPPAALAEA